ncbi:RagB/SusD family nutrient uptake outer membrane protein [Zobellia amurskyensis]|uniref:RagB/SusD family nutrient uptake outer membrane protein n=1 Tax=Zobellia amurskyensis TaxID=248905 RepID=A0A7X2ZU74_9FLAO|nr:RagB/SusD family nutrient uptake outer membrane protein [Zobellia amurskyensis]MUH36467.1 RagB/SusD family nutrient uptake outer membrane protein [Zobellia amurskyensis]
MKNIIYKLLPCIAVLFTSCEDEFIDLTPPAAITDAVFFTEADHFKQSANSFYTDLLNWNDQGIYADHGSDLVGYEEASAMQAYSRGETQAPASDGYYSSAYSAIRDMNLLLVRAEDYEGDDIGPYVAATYFHRAYQYFFLVQRFGGVPLVTEPLDVDSEELNAPRNSRYEVVAQILKDLDQAIAGLPNEAAIPSEDKGKISKEAAMAFKADVLLHEATWMKYVGTVTDGDGTSTGAGSAGENASDINAYFQEVVTLCKSIMDSGTFELWNYNDVLDNLSSNFLFILEDGGSNPAGLDKATNKEFIFYGKYDFTFRQAGTLLSHVYQGRVKPSRKMMDLFLSDDGLPIDQSPKFQGYTNPEDEFQNRDLRMTAYFTDHKDLGTIPTIENNDQLRLSGTNNYGYFNAKFMSWNWGTDLAYRETMTESFDMPFIRLAEVYLMYAEALYELNGSITDAQLNESINLVKARAGLPPLSNAFAATNNLDILDEIRRERTIELYAEGATRFNDLKRWGIAEEELNETIFGAVVEGTVWETDTDLYDPSLYGFPEEVASTGVGARRAVVVQPSSIRNFSIDNYLFPLPTNEIGLNESLLQNPGY